MMFISPVLNMPQVNVSKVFATSPVHFGAEPPATPPTILYMDSRKEVSDMIRKAAEGQNYTFNVANTVEKAKETLADPAKRPQLIIYHYDLPNQGPFTADYLTTFVGTHNFKLEQIIITASNKPSGRTKNGLVFIHSDNLSYALSHSLLSSTLECAKQAETGKPRKMQDMARAATHLRNGLALMSKYKL